MTNAKVKIQQLCIAYHRRLYQIRVLYNFLEKSFAEHISQCFCFIEFWFRFIYFSISSVYYIVNDGKLLSNIVLSDIYIYMYMCVLHVGFFSSGDTCVQEFIFWSCDLPAEASMLLSLSVSLVGHCCFSIAISSLGLRRLSCFFVSD